MKNLTIQQLIKRAKSDLCLALKMIKEFENAEKARDIPAEEPLNEIPEEPSEEISEDEIRDTV